MSVPKFLSPRPMPYPYVLPRTGQWLEVVDLQDRPLLLMPHAQLLEQGLAHRKVRVALRDPLGRLLLVRPLTSQGTALPLALPGTRVRAGESREEAALRVLAEELGLSGVHMPEPGLREPQGLHANRTTVLSAFLPPEAPRPQCLGVAEVLFVDRDELKGLARHFAELLTVELAQAIHTGYLWQALQQADRPGSADSEDE